MIGRLPGNSFVFVEFEEGGGVLGSEDSRAAGEAVGEGIDGRALFAGGGAGAGGMLGVGLIDGGAVEGGGIGGAIVAVGAGDGIVRH